jgi:hypothetical protein
MNAHHNVIARLLSLGILAALPALSLGCSSMDVSDNDLADDGDAEEITGHASFGATAQDGCSAASGTITLSPNGDLGDAINQAASTGKNIVLNNGSYSLGKITKSGTAAKPIILCAKNKLQVTITGSTTIQGSHVRLWGLSFGKNTVEVLGDDVWVQRSEFSGFPAGKAIQVTVEGDGFHFWRSRIKDSKGRGLSFDVAAGGKNGEVYQSHFAHFSGNINATEALQLGQSSSSSKIDANIEVVESLFEDCMTTGGENETLSVKSSSNVVRGSTFLNTRYLMNRHGQHNLYVSNWIEGGNGLNLNDLDNTALAIKTVDTGNGVRVASGDVTPAGFPDQCGSDGESCNPTATGSKVIGCDLDTLIIGDDAGAKSTSGTSVEGVKVNGKLIDTAKIGQYLGPKASSNSVVVKPTPSMTAPMAVKLNANDVGP